MVHNLKIKDLPKVDRPREKLIKYGPEKLSDSELLAILLHTGTKELNVVELSKKILSGITKKGITEIDYQQLSKITGLGPAKACEIVACFELGRRFLQNKQSTLIISPKHVWNELAHIRDKKKEHFVVFFLDTRNQKIKHDIVSIGTLNTNLVHPREVFEPAVKYLAAQIILAHNHPSGDVSPSNEDELVTQQLVNAGKLLGIPVLDHIIVSSNGYYSLASEKPRIFDKNE